MLDFFVQSVQKKTKNVKSIGDRAQKAWASRSVGAAMETFLPTQMRDPKHITFFTSLDVHVKFNCFWGYYTVSKKGKKLEKNKNNSSRNLLQGPNNKPCSGPNYCKVIEYR